MSFGLWVLASVFVSCFNTLFHIFPINFENMKSTLLWILALYVLVSFMIIVSHSVQVVADDDSDSEAISIDCGYNQESYYWDDNNFYYEADGSKFVESGQIQSVSSEYTLTSKQEQLGLQLNTLRSFHEGKRNCYTLRPKHGRNNKYLVRAFFRYGNYDTKDFTPVFQMHLGVNYWTTVKLIGSTDIVRSEIIHVVLSDHIEVCLVNIGRGIPFISLLELYPLPFSMYHPTYEASLLPLKLSTRASLGMVEDSVFFRYPDDIYRRSWFRKVINNTIPINTSEAIDDDSTEYRIPKEVLSTAIQSLNSSFSLNIKWDHSRDYEYYVYLHFFDFEKHSQNQKRSMEIAFTDTIRDSVTLEYQQLQTKVTTIPKGVSLNNISITASTGSSLPPMINAYEIYRVQPQPNLPTHQDDVDAMRNIKHGYNIQRISWRGDPCMPKEYRWEGVTCNYSDNFSRVTSLNLSSSKLEGEMVTYFSKLEMLEFLDLSNNQLAGEIPQSLAKLANLKVLNLTGNDLIGSVPEALTLKEKSGLTLRLDGNRGLCQTARSCKTKKLIGPLVASALASMAVLVIILYIPMMLYRRKRIKQQNVTLCKKGGGDLKSKCQAFCEDEVVSITNNFESVIGEGGFGKVYLGKLQDGTQVAVKLLSKSSQQGFNEFESEAKLLSTVYHKNLLSLVGYCDDGDMKALIYEYMPKGNLHHRLSGKNPYVLKWNERLQIALDAAFGLNYLHNGCNPPIIHRDLKSSNILLSENMHAKIADFGLCKAFASDIDTHISTRPAGTFGYLDPEFYRSGNLHKFSDVYSFGIILLELMTGQSAIIKTPGGTSHIVDWVTPKFEVGDIKSIMDPKLEGDFNIASARKVLEIAMCCIKPDGAKRPDISNVENELKQCSAMDTLFLESAESSSLFSSTTTFDTSSYQCGSHSPPSVR